MSHAGDLQFSVDGNPRPQGSKTAVRSGNKARVIEADVIVCPVGPTQGAAA